MSRTPLSEGRSSVPLRDRVQGYAHGNSKAILQALPLLRSGDRIQHLPLILVGPILRRTESNAVTVWIALKAPREVTLKVYATQDNGSTIKTVLLEGTRSTVPLGKYLHIVAVTAKPVNEETGKLDSVTPSGVLEPGQIYAYDLSFGSQNLAQALQLAIPSPQITVSYFDHQLPTFAIPPDDLNHLRLAHGSCRKLHGGGHDALPILDDLIGHYAKEPNSRLHQLFFTGDQIYGDDVADPLLWVATDIGDTLLGWEENLPFQIRPTGGYESWKPSELKPGERTDIAKDYAGLTAMLIDTPEEAKSHLFSMGEYFSLYMLVWSPILWPDRLPLGKDIHKDSKLAKQWDRQSLLLKECFSQLWKVRRAMANVPVYMICDDHDLSDDWYLNRAWCNSVLGKPLGKRVVQNGLLAYAIFQAWGNTPDQFQEAQPGGNLLKAAALWSASAGTDESASQEIAKCLGLPQIEPETGLPKFKLDEDVLVMDRDYPDGTQPIEWHYSVRSLKHEVIVLDTRTWRGYPKGTGAIDPPMLLCPSAFKKQIQKPLEFTDQLNQSHESDIEATFIVVPTNLVSLRIIDIVQQWELEKGNVFDSDVGDAWNLHEFALSRLLAELFKRRQQVVVLSGDIHFAGAIRINYWARRHFEPRKAEGRGCWCREPASLQGSTPEGQKAEGVYPSAEEKSHLATDCGQSSQSPSERNIKPSASCLLPSLEPPEVEFYPPLPSVQHQGEQNEEQRPYPTGQVLAQLTASAFKNSELKTYFIHTRAKSLAPEQPQDWAGWNEPPQLVEIQVTQETIRVVDVDLPATEPVVRQILGARGNWRIAWEIALKDAQCLPDWQYHVEWLKRGKAKLAPWEEKQKSSAPSEEENSPGLLAGLGNLLSMLWRNQWLQEGEEVIGHSNFGVISLEWSPNHDEGKAVIQDSFWRPPWKPRSVVYSRYYVPLRVDNVPRLLKVVSPNLIQK